MIVRKSYQEGQSLEDWKSEKRGFVNKRIFSQGNQCRKFLKLIDKLEGELMMQSGDVIIRGLPYIETFRAFDKVVKMCFGVVLQPGYESAIDSFKNSYMNLNLTVTPKVARIYYHKWATMVLRLSNCL